MAHQVFIAYSPQDRAPATGACLALEKEGIRCWMSPRDLRPELTEEEAVSEALKGSLLMVLVVSPSSSHSPMVLHQVTSAVSASLPLLLFRIGGATLSRPMQVLLTEPIWLDASDPPSPMELKAMVDSVLPRLAREAQSRLKPWDEESIRERLEDARVLLRYRLVDKALAKLVEMREEYPFNPAIRADLIQAYQDLGRLKDVAVELMGLARIYDGLGERDHAAELRKQARELTPLAQHPVIEITPVEVDEPPLDDPQTKTLLPDDLVEDV